MIITLTEHEEVEKLLLSYGFVRERSTETGRLSVYSFKDKKLISYNEAPPSTIQHLYFQKDSFFTASIFSTPWIDSILKDSTIPKTYRIRVSKIRKDTTTARIFYVESGDIRVITAIEGMDHAIEIFSDYSAFLKLPPDNLCSPSSLFVEYLSQK